MRFCASRRLPVPPAAHPKSNLSLPAGPEVGPEGTVPARPAVIISLPTFPLPQRLITDASAGLKLEAFWAFRTAPADFRC